MKRIVKILKRWRLRRAQEQYAYWKAERETREQCMAGNFLCRTTYHAEQIVTAASNEAKFMERVEQLIRQ